MTASTGPPPVPSQIPPKDLEVLDFEVIDEGWNNYELADYTVLKARVVMTRLARPRIGPIGQYGVGAQTLFSATAPPEKRGSPMAIPPQSEWEGLPKEPVKILTSSEPWNKYRIPKTGDILQVKLVVSEVFRVKDQFDQYGEPFYIVTHGPLISPGSKGSITIGSS